MRGINKKREENREKNATFCFGKVLFGHTFPQVGPKSKKLGIKFLSQLLSFINIALWIYLVGSFGNIL